MKELKQILLRIPINLHEKLRYMAYLKNKSINQIITDMLEKTLKDIKPPREK